MALPKFRDEKEFREKWISPFLSKLGFIQVTHYHGSQEQGKDHYFADVDRFENVRFYAVQAKLGDIGSGRDLDELLSQVKRCFEVEIKDRKTGENRRISAVYVMATGKISQQAHQRIAGYCRQEHYGENVYFLDGDQLDLLERQATNETDKEERARLVAIMRECELNQHGANSIIRICGNKKLPQIRLETDAVKSGLYYSATNLIPSDAFQSVLMRCRLVNGLLDILCNTIREDLLSKAVEDARAALEVISELLTDTLTAIQTLDERYNVTIDIEGEGA